MNMLNKTSKWRSIFTGDIGRKVWVTIFLIIIYRLLMNIPLPGFSPLLNAGQPAEKGAFTLIEFVDMLSGGSLLKTSILGLGILPYLVAQQLMQILIPIIPALQRHIQEDPRGGREFMEKWNYYLVIPVGILEALFFIGIITMNCNDQKFVTQILNLSVTSKLTLVTILVTGSFFSLWIGSLISEFGIRGQGLSLIIFSGIVGRLPGQIAELLTQPNVAKNLAIYIAVLLFSIVMIVYLQQGRRNVPIMYPGRRMGNRISMPVKGTLPLMINMGGTQGFLGSQLLVAVATFYAPLASCSSIPWVNAIALGAMSIFSEKSLSFGPVAFLSVFFFSIFYGSLIFEQQDYGNNLKRAGAAVPGVDRGEPTQRYLGRVNRRISVAGAFILGLIAITPWLLNTLAGTDLSVLDGEKMVIMVGVIRDIFMNLDAQMKLNGYQDSLLGY